MKTLLVLGVAMCAAVLGVAMFAAVLLSACGHDDSDPPDGHSGFNVYTDYKTGCQYIGSEGALGGLKLTPRMGRDGKQLCGGEHE